MAVTDTPRFESRNIHVADENLVSSIAERAASPKGISKKSYIKMEETTAFRPWSVTASAPGKILLLGGYSVLERPNVAYVLAVDAYVHVKCKPLKTDEIIMRMPQFKTEIKTTKAKLSEEKNGPAKFVLSAISAVFDYFRSKGINYTGFKLTTKSDKEFSVNSGKSGLGSSAAVTVATIAALFEAFGLSAKENIDEIHKIAQIAHSKAQNKIGSGFDIAAACYGSIEYSRFSNLKLLDFSMRKISFPLQLKLVFASFPAESMSTTDAVAKVMEFSKSRPDLYVRSISGLNRANSEAILALEVLETSGLLASRPIRLEKNAMENFKMFFETGRALTKNLGKAAALNTALNIAKGEFFWVYDADSIASRDLLRNLVSRFFEKGNSDVGAVVAVTLIKNQGTWIEKMQRIEYIMAAFVRKLLGSVDTLHITNALSLFKTSVIRKLGGFDVGNLTEDLEIALKLRYNG